MLKEKQIEILKNQLEEKRRYLLNETSTSKTIIKELLLEPSYDDIDYAEVSNDSYSLNILRDKQVHDLKEIELALKKIEQNCYGICEMCDDKIGIKRLRVKPHARFCVECREEYERNLTIK